jgi:mono/diheme cytochrome c family protein
MNQTNCSRSFVYGISVAAAIQGLIWSQAALAEQTVSFSRDVQPMFTSRCVSCHHPGGEGYQASGLDLRSYAGLMKGTKHGKIVVAGDPLTSNLMVLIEGRSDPSIRMPHRKWPLLKQQIEIIGNWVRQGAKDN